MRRYELMSRLLIFLRIFFLSQGKAVFMEQFSLMTTAVCLLFKFWLSLLCTLVHLELDKHTDLAGQFLII